MEENLLQQEDFITMPPTPFKPIDRKKSTMPPLPELAVPVEPQRDQPYIEPSTSTTTRAPNTGLPNKELSRYSKDIINVDERDEYEETTVPKPPYSPSIKVDDEESMKLTYIVAGSIAGGVAVVGGVAVTLGVLASQGKIGSASGFTPVSQA